MQARACLRGEGTSPARSGCEKKEMKQTEAADGFEATFSTTNRPFGGEETAGEEEPITTGTAAGAGRGEVSWGSAGGSGTVSLGVESLSIVGVLSRLSSCLTCLARYCL